MSRMQHVNFIGVEISRAAYPETGLSRPLVPIVSAPEKPFKTALLRRKERGFYALEKWRAMVWQTLQVDSQATENTPSTFRWCINLCGNWKTGLFQGAA